MFPQWTVTIMFVVRDSIGIWLNFRSGYTVVYLCDWYDDARMSGA